MKVVRLKMQGEMKVTKTTRTTRRTRRPDTSCHTYHATPAIIDALIKLDRRDPNAAAPYSPAIVNRRIVH